MKFTWKAIILSPLLVPLICSGVLAIATASNSWFFGFLLFFILGAFISYGATIFLFLPCLFLTSKWITPTLLLTCILGAALGVVSSLPVMWMAWKSSGPDSGPPQDTFAEFFLQWFADPSALLFLIFPFAGLVTAAAYWFLSREQPQLS
jgi:hypothetical protein